MKFESFFSDIFATIIGGGLLTLILFFIKERLRVVDLNGAWVLEQETITSEYNPYKGMTLRYLVLLSQNGNEIYGSAEKVCELVNGKPPKEYVGADRIRVEIAGHVERRFLSAHKVVIHTKEFGEKRESSTFYSFDLKSANDMRGRFASTISNQKGSVVCSRNAS